MLAEPPSVLPSPRNPRTLSCPGTHVDSVDKSPRLRHARVPLAYSGEPHLHPACEQSNDTQKTKPFIRVDHSSYPEKCQPMTLLDSTLHVSLPNRRKIHRLKPCHSTFFQRTGALSVEHRLANLPSNLRTETKTATGCLVRGVLLLPLFSRYRGSGVGKRPLGLFVNFRRSISIRKIERRELREGRKGRRKVRSRSGMTLGGKGCVLEGTLFLSGIHRLFEIRKIAKPEEVPVLPITRNFMDGSLRPQRGSYRVTSSG